MASEIIIFNLPNALSWMPGSSKSRLTLHHWRRCSTYRIATSIYQKGHLLLSIYRRDQSFTLMQPNQIGNCQLVSTTQRIKVVVDVFNIAMYCIGDWCLFQCSRHQLLTYAHVHVTTSVPPIVVMFGRPLPKTPTTSMTYKN